MYELNLHFRDFNKWWLLDMDVQSGFKKFCFTRKAVEVN